MQSEMLKHQAMPALRVLTSHHRHHYHRTIYNELADRVVDGTTLPPCYDTHNFPPSLEHWDVEYLRQEWEIFHLHWPEIFGPELGPHLAIIERLAAASISIVWTQHNLVPHIKDQRYAAIFEAWAGAASAVIHHSQWGMEQVLARYRFRPDAIHRVIPHPHFGNLSPPSPGDRRRIEEELQLTPGLVRLGIVGAPRTEKQVAMAIRAFITCNRPDLELLVLCLRRGDTVPEHPRVHARRYEFVPRNVYNARLSAIDLLVLPFAAQGMLTTGSVADVFGLGIPALISDWPFLQEIVGDAGIPYGPDETALVECLRSLDAAKIERARQACLRLRELYEPARIANATFQLLEMVARKKKSAARSYASAGS
jgi:glycosyltransferase involved in cell wall biosynthesis